MIQASGEVRVRIATTGEEQTLDAAELEWDAIEADERQMGLETHWQTTWEFTDSDGRDYSVEWNAWEYPTGVLNHEETKPSNDVKILADLQAAIVDDD